MGTILLDIMLNTKMSHFPTCWHSWTVAPEPLKEGKYDGMIWDSQRATAIIPNQTQWMAKLDTERPLILFKLYHSISLSQKFMFVSVLIWKEWSPDTGKSRGSVQHLDSEHGDWSLTRILRNKCFQETFTALPFVGNKGF